MAAKRLSTNEDAIEKCEKSLEECVSEYIGKMSILWLEVYDESKQNEIERNAIALLSNYGRRPIDSPSEDWLGHSSGIERIHRSGLWNSRYVKNCYNSSFLDDMEYLINEMN